MESSSNTNNIDVSKQEVSVNEPDLESAEKDIKNMHLEEQMPSGAFELKNPQKGSDADDSFSPWNKSKVSSSALSLPAALDFVKRKFNVKNESFAILKMFVTELHLHPVPLQMAISYIQGYMYDEEKPIKKFLHLLSAEGCSIDVSNIPGWTEDVTTTAKIWSLILKGIKEMKTGVDYLATQIMLILSFFEPENIPLSIFTYETSGFREEELDIAVAVMVTNEVFSMSPSGDNLNFSASHHRMAQVSMPPCWIQDTLERGLYMLEGKMSRNTKNPELIKALLPHAQSAWNHALKHDEIMRKHVKFSIFLCIQLQQVRFGMFEASLKLARDSLLNLERVFGPGDDNIIILKYCEALALYGLEKYSDSLEVLNAIGSEINDGLNKIWIRHMLLELIAQNYNRQGDLQEEVKTLEAIGVLQLGAYGTVNDGPWTEALKRAVKLSKQGKLDEALELFRGIYEDQKQKSRTGEEHTLTLFTMHSMEANCKTTTAFQGVQTQQQIFNRQEILRRHGKRLESVDFRISLQKRG